MTILCRKLIIIDNRKPKNCVKNQILPNVGIRKLDKVVKSENWTKVGIRNHVKWQNLPKIATENRFYTKFKFVKINTVCNNSLLQWRLLDLLGMAQLLNWKFCLIFVKAWSWWFATESKLVKRCVQHIFRTYAESFSPIFPKGIYWNCYRKFCVKIENRTELCW